MKQVTKAFCFAVLLALLVSCTDGKANNVIEDWPWDDPVEPENPSSEPVEKDSNQDYVDLGWTNVGKIGRAHV